MKPLTKLGSIYWKIKHLKRYNTTDFFRNINIEINTSCNRRCSYCPNSIYDRGLIENEKLIPIEFYKKIIDELSSINYNGGISPVGYGEPLLDKRLIDIIKYTRQRLPEANIKLFSNGDLLDINKYNSLIDAGLTELTLTQYEGQMSKNLKDVLEYEKNNPSRKCKLIHKEFNSTIQLSNRGGEVTPNIVESNPGCIYTSSPIVIDVNGNVILCCNDYFSSHIFGNVKEESVLDIWRKEEYKNIRKMLKKGKFILPICKRCRVLDGKSSQNAREKKE